MKECCNKINLEYVNRIYFCPICGKKHNKARLGLSAFDYAGFIGGKAKDIILKLSPIFYTYENKNYSKELVYCKVVPLGANGIINSSEVSLNFLSESIIYSRYKGNSTYNYKSFSHRTDTFSLKVDEGLILDNLYEDFEREVTHSILHRTTCYPNIITSTLFDVKLSIIKDFDNLMIKLSKS